MLLAEQYQAKARKKQVCTFSIALLLFFFLSVCLHTEASVLALSVCLCLFMHIVSSSSCLNSSLSSLKANLEDCMCLPLALDVDCWHDLRTVLHSVHCGGGAHSGIAHYLGHDKVSKM